MFIHPRVLSALAIGLILAGCATTGGNVPPPAGSSTMAQNPACLSQTGSRIPSSASDCVNPGRSYSHDDVNSTGATTAGGALQILDPSVTVHH
jgi:hypothetical protein